MPDTNTNFKVLQWNTRSVNSNRPHLLTLIRNIEPDMIMLNETWLKKHYRFNIKNYSIIRNDRADGFGGIIKNNIRYNEIKLDISLQSCLFQFIIIKLSNFSFKIGNLNIFFTLPVPKFIQSALKFSFLFHEKVENLRDCCYNITVANVSFLLQIADYPVKMNLIFGGINRATLPWIINLRNWAGGCMNTWCRR
nr:unnamed protein product [Callosobruchus analis]